MKLFFLTISLLTSLLSAKYLTNESCKECHEDIYYEYQSSYHSKTYFNDELHRKVADKVSSKTYDCAPCHMPGAVNIEELVNGKHRPTKYEVEQTDAISCFFCHQIGFVKQAHAKNINYLSKKPAGYKPSMFGSLKNADDSDKHEMLNNPIYKKNVCLGCHSHKRNSHDVMIFNAMEDKQDSTECIKCHMPYTRGPVEKTNKKGRSEHRSHDFPGIHNMEMVKEGVDISISSQNNIVEVTLENKMPHPLIIQASRLKYLEITLMRDGKVIWKNFKDSPMEDKQGAFVIEFLDESDKFVSIPAFAYKRGFDNNLKAKESRTLKYEVPSIKSGDTIKVSMYVVLAKPSCSEELNLKDKRLTTPILMKSSTYKQP
jgi:nitrate reductase cytochrome c-type subunit